MNAPMHECPPKPTFILFNRLWNSSGVVTSTLFSSQEKHGLDDIVRDVLDIILLSSLAATWLFKTEVLLNEVIAPLFMAAECTYFLGIDFMWCRDSTDERRVMATALWSNMVWILDLMCRRQNPFFLWTEWIKINNHSTPPLCRQLFTL